jgi:hypothetical protein
VAPAWQGARGAASDGYCMIGGGARLEVAYLWRRHLLGYRLLAPGESARLGTSTRVTFIAPAGAAWPRRGSLLQPLKDGAYRLRLWPGMSGQIRARGELVDVAATLAGPAPPRRLGKPAVYRDLTLVNGDGGELVIDATTELRLRLAFVDPPPVIGRPRRHDQLLFKTVFGTMSITLALLAVLLFIGDRMPAPSLSIWPDRVVSAKALAEASIKKVEEAKAKAEEARAKAEAAARKRADREAAEARRAKEKEGKLGRADAKNANTVLPKAREDVLREKVSRTGLLAVLGNTRPGGSGLGRLLARTNDNDLEGALTGLEGAKLVAGKGAGGLGVAGTGLGGGGNSFGHIQGSGNLDVGAGRGRGRKGPSLGSGHEKQVSIGMETGSPDAEGGLSKEQINRVVRAHAAAVKYCYEKELQRHQGLSGRIDLAWVIRPNGTVDRAHVARSTMGNKEVEGCIERQVHNWQFPKSNAETIVGTYPLLFKGNG